MPEKKTLANFKNLTSNVRLLRPGEVFFIVSNMDGVIGVDSRGRGVAIYEPLPEPPVEV